MALPSLFLVALMRSAGRLARALHVMALAIGVSTSFAGELRVTPDQFDFTLTPGQRQVVTGSVTNVTGFDLLASEIFFSVSGYPADALGVDILLGLDDVVLSDRTRSSGLALFALLLSDVGAALTPFSIEIAAFDVNGHSAEAFTLNIQSTSSVPEPDTTALLVLGGLLLAATRAQRHGTASC